MASSDSPAPGREFVVVSPRPGEATLDELQWEWEADRRRLAALPAVRSAAEKWITAIASLTGVFGIVALVKGPEDISKVDGEIGDWLWHWDLAWTVGAVILAAGIVWAMRWSTWRWARLYRPALRFALTLTLTFVVLSVFAELLSWQTAAMVCIGVALVAAGGAIFAGARAAYGPIYAPPTVTGRMLRGQDQVELTRARGYLMLAISAALFAIAALAAGVFITWSRTPEAEVAGKVLVLRKDSAPVCGTLLTRSEPIMIREDARSVLEVRQAEIVSLVAVPTCPPASR